MTDTKSIKVNVCDECQTTAYVQVHPRNFCGHSNRGTLTEFVPRTVADELAEALEWYERRAHVAARSIAGQALDKYREAVGSDEPIDPWVCNKCGQRLSSPSALCNSGLHVGPGDGEEAQGEAVRLSDSVFDVVTDP